MALTLSAQTFDATNGIWTATGVNDASSAAASIYPGFKPRQVVVRNLTDGIITTWDNQMTNGRALSQAAAGAITYVAAGSGVYGIDSSQDANAATAASGQTPTTAAGGFTVRAAVLLASKTFSIVAYK